MKKKIILFLLSCSFINTYAQEKMLTKEGFISFFSHTPVEDIKAENKQVLSIVDTETGKIAVSLLMKSFRFKKSLMQEHFNENYIESDSYPKATFKGAIRDWNSLDANTKEVVIDGVVRIRKIDKAVQVKASIQKQADGLLLQGQFRLKVADFDIKIPAIVINNIAKTVRVNFILQHKPYKP